MRSKYFWSSPFKINAIVVLAVLLPLLVTADAKSNALQALVTDTVTTKKLPGMIAAIVDEKGVRAIAAAGVRIAGSDHALTDQDLIHIGSCTKAMTSTMLATLIADDLLSWETTIAEALPQLKSAIHSDYHQLTLWQLVSHRSGLPANAKDWWAFPTLEIKERRLAIMRENLKGAPTGKAGTYTYSNLGYLVAGCMAEQVSGQSWEQLMKTRLFKPLGMASAGFGPPGEPTGAHQPRGHLKASDGSWQPRYFDNAEALGPAGTVHCSVRDWAKFIALQLPKSQTRFLPRKTLDRLVDSKTGYAAGWVLGERPWAKVKTYSHNGTNPMWYATVWVAPTLNRAFIVATNSYDDNAPKICDGAIGELIRINQN